MPWMLGLVLVDGNEIGDATGDGEPFPTLRLNALCQLPSNILAVGHHLSRCEDSGGNASVEVEFSVLESDARSASVVGDVAICLWPDNTFLKG